MKLRCLLFGCLYRHTKSKTVDGFFTLTGKCIRCGKEKVLVKDNIKKVEKFLGLDAAWKKIEGE